MGSDRRRVVRLHQVNSIQDIQNNIRALGYVLGLDDEAERVVSGMQATLKSVAQGRDRRSDWRVMYFCAGRITGTNTTFESLLGYVGAHNVAADMAIVGSRPSCFRSRRKTQRRLETPLPKKERPFFAGVRVRFRPARGRMIDWNE